MNGTRHDELRSIVRVLRALSMDYAEGRPLPTHSRVSQRAGVATKTVQRLVRKVERGEPPWTGITPPGQGSLHTLWDLAGSLTITSSEPHVDQASRFAEARQLFETSTAHQDLIMQHEGESPDEATLRLVHRIGQTAANLSTGAVIAVSWSDTSLAGKWHDAFSHWMRQVSQYPEVIAVWETVWSDRWWNDGLTKSITGCLWGMAQATHLKVGDRPARHQPVPDLDLDIGVPTLRAEREALALAPYTGTDVDPDDVTTKPGSPTEMLQSRAETEGYVSGLLLCGAFEEALTFLDEHYPRSHTLPLDSRSLLVQALGIGLLGYGAEMTTEQSASGADNGGDATPLEPPDDVWCTAMEITRRLVPEDQLHTTTGMHTDAVRLRLWLTWIRAKGKPDPDVILDEAPLILGAHSVYKATTRGQLWTAAPDLIPMLHDAAGAAGHARLEALMAASAREVLTTRVHSRPLPVGLRTYLVALATLSRPHASGRVPASSSSQRGVLTNLRIAIALGEKVPDNVIQEVREILDVLPTPPRLSTEV